MNVVRPGKVRCSIDKTFHSKRVKTFHSRVFKRVRPESRYSTLERNSEPNLPHAITFVSWFMPLDLYLLSISIVDLKLESTMRMAE